MLALDLSYTTPTRVDKNGTFEVLFDKGRQLRYDTPRARFITPLDPFTPVVQPEFDWLWQNRIPRGRVTVIEGPAGAGKTFLTADLAARVTAGRAFARFEKGESGQENAGAPGVPNETAALTPTLSQGARENGAESGVTSDGTLASSATPTDEILANSATAALNIRTFMDSAPGAGEVIYVCSERESDDAVTPRVTRSGADVLRLIYLSQIDMNDSIRGPVGSRKMEFPHDVNVLERYLKDCPCTRLVVIDPLRDFCATPRLMRQALTLLDDLAAKYKVAIVVTIQAEVKFTPEGQIRHVPRTWDEAARYVWCVTRDPSDSELRRFEPKRTSFCKEPEGIAFRVTEMGAVAWEPLPPRETKFQKCKNWLVARMSKGAVWAEEALRDGKAFGFSETMLYRARDELKIQTDRVGGIAGTGSWWWTCDGKPPDGQGAPPEEESLEELKARARDLFRYLKIGDEFVPMLSQAIRERLPREELAAAGGAGRRERRGRRDGHGRSKPPRNGKGRDRVARPDHREGRGADRASENGRSEKKSNGEFLGDLPGKT